MNHDGTLLLLPLQSLLSCYTLLVVLASVSCFKFEDATDKCRDSEMMTVKNKSYKGATIKLTCHIHRTKSFGIVDLPRSVPVGKEWLIGRFSRSLRMAPFPDGFTDTDVARLWTRPTTDAEARLSSICRIRIKIYTRTSSNKW